MNSKKQASYA